MVWVCVVCVVSCVECRVRVRVRAACACAREKWHLVRIGQEGIKGGEEAEHAVGVHAVPRQPLGVRDFLHCGHPQRNQLILRINLKMKQY